MNYIKGFKTKSLKSVKDSDRIFEGVSTVEMVDMDGEITSRDMMLKQFQTWMDRGAPISDRHSNRIIGKGISFAPVEVDDAKSKKKFYGIKLRGKIFKDHMLDNKVWQAIKSGAYKGLSYGGANLANREPVKQIDGTMAYKLNDVELYEVSVCPEPSAPLALITDFNRLAKSMTAEELSGMDVTEREDGKVAMKCDKFRCYVPKNEQMEGIVGLNNTHDIAKSKMVEHEDDKKIEAKTEEESEDKKDKSIDRLIGVVSKFVDKSIEQNKAFEERFTALESKIKDSTHMSPAQGAKVKLPQTYNDNAPGESQGSESPAPADSEAEGDGVSMEKKSMGYMFRDDVEMVAKWWDDLPPSKRKMLAPEGKHKELGELNSDEIEKAFYIYDTVAKADDEDEKDDDYEDEDVEETKKEYIDTGRPTQFGNMQESDGNPVLKAARSMGADRLGELANMIHAGQFGTDENRNPEGYPVI